MTLDSPKPQSIINNQAVESFLRDVDEKPNSIRSDFDNATKEVLRYYTAEEKETFRY